jgi:hypothetical protein
MNKMYRYLDKGLPVEEALRRSKIDLIHSDEINPKLKTANFWANFIYIGKISDRTNSFSTEVILGTLLIIALILCVNFVFKKSKSFKSDPEEI